MHELHSDLRASQAVHTMSPGTRKDSPFRVSVVGIDGSGKGSVTDTIAEGFGQERRVARIGLPTYTIVEGQRSEPYRRVLGAIDRLQSLPGGVDIALNVLLQGRVVEPGLVRSMMPELLIGSRDYVIDPSVYATLYSPTLSKRPMGLRMDVMQRITGLSPRNAIFFLSVPPEVAVERLERRLAAQKAGVYIPGDRRQRDKHENVHDLKTVRREYHEALNVVTKHSSTQVFEIDATREQDEVAGRVRSAIASFMQGTQPQESSVLT